MCKDVAHGVLQVRMVYHSWKEKQDDMDKTSKKTTAVFIRHVVSTRSPMIASIQLIGKNFNQGTIKHSYSLISIEMDDKKTQIVTG